MDLSLKAALQQLVASLITNIQKCLVTQVLVVQSARQSEAEEPSPVTVAERQKRDVAALKATRLEKRAKQAAAVAEASSGAGTVTV